MNARERHRRRLRDDYASVAGEPFKHFFCPILWVDEPTELCLGHVVPESSGESSKARVLQRADVDSFYGTVAEDDFVSVVKARQKTRGEILSDPKFFRKLRPRMLVADPR